jgi:pimeloyl-ACP methyl ester carboxylesterase
MRVRSQSACMMLAVLVALPFASHAQIPDTAWVAVEGHRMHMLTSGRGSPTVVFEAGASGTHRMWGAIQKELSAIARVVSYDRAGLGASELSKRTRSARNIADELHSALRAAKLPPPYLLVGHSAGGLFVRAFAAMFPNEVTGLVLVDPAPEDFYDRAMRQFPKVYQYFDSIDMADTSGSTPGQRAEDDAWDSVLVEVRTLDRAVTAPAIILSSPRADLKEIGAIWTDEHRRWALRSPRREYVRVEGVGHQIHRERPGVIIDAVKRLLASTSRR